MLELLEEEEGAEQGIAVQEKEETAEEIVLKSWASVELTRESIHEELFRRSILLEDSPFNKDSRMIERGIDNLLNYLAHHYNQNLGNIERRHTRIAALFHDHGKSGWVGATDEQQRAVVDIFSAENIGPQHLQLPLKEVIPQFFEELRAKEILELLEGGGVSTEITIRAFYDLHAQWTHDLLEAYPCDGISRTTRVIAASHHIARGINPYNIEDSEVPIEALLIGAAEDYLEIIEERSLIGVDVYQANVRRSHATHEQAMAVVHKVLDEKFGHDAIMALVIEAIDVLGKDGKLFI